jgi:O-acetyl-ADP-ribose deacetylase (regulator of RNase III)
VPFYYGVHSWLSGLTRPDGYPIEEATHIALRTTRTFLENNDSVTRVVYVVFSAADEEVYRRLAPEYFPPA